MKKLIIFLILTLNTGCTPSQHSFDVRKIDIAQTYPIVICGGGIAGYTSAIYLGMGNLTPLIIEGPLPGGLITQSDSVRNWPGEVEIKGSVLAEKLRNHAKTAGTIFNSAQIVNVDFNSWPYTITTESLDGLKKRADIKALSVIIVMGTRSNYLGASGETEYWGKGVSNCAHCDGNLYKDKVVAVVGGGDSAITEATYLARLAKKVYVIVRKDFLRARDKRKDELYSNPVVEFMFNTEVNKISGDKSSLKMLTLKNNKTGELKNLPIDGLFLAIGSTPNTELFRSKLDLDEKGYITIAHSNETSKPGVFAVGDIVDPFYKQAISAAGRGCEAAIDAMHFLEEMGYDPKKNVTAVSNKITQVPVQQVQKDMRGLIEVKSDSELLNEISKSASNKLPVIIDFYATWCSPCKRIAPMFHAFADEIKGKVRCIKVDYSIAPTAVQKYGIKGFPTFIFLDKNGKQVDVVVGADMEAIRAKSKKL